MKGKLHSSLSYGGALVMLPNLFYEVTGDRQAVEILENLGMGGNGRVWIAVVEVIAVILLVMPRTRPVGSLLGMLVMSGPLYSHMSTSGMEVMTEGGSLFYMALSTFGACTTSFFMRYGTFIRQIKSVLSIFRQKK